VLRKQSQDVLPQRIHLHLPILVDPGRNRLAERHLRSGETEQRSLGRGGARAGLTGARASLDPKVSVYRSEKRGSEEATVKAACGFGSCLARAVKTTSLSQSNTKSCRQLLSTK
jgi:hypothetical protein